MGRYVSKAPNPRPTSHSASEWDPGRSGIAASRSLANSAVGPSLGSLAQGRSFACTWDDERAPHHRLESFEMRAQLEQFIATHTGAGIWLDEVCSSLAAPLDAMHYCSTSHLVRRRAPSTSPAHGVLRMRTSRRLAPPQDLRQGDGLSFSPEKSIMSRSSRPGPRIDGPFA